MGVDIMRLIGGCAGCRRHAQGLGRCHHGGRGCPGNRVRTLMRPTKTMTGPGFAHFFAAAPAPMGLSRPH